MNLSLLLTRLTATDEAPNARPFLYSTVAILFVLGVCLTAAQFSSTAIFTLLLLTTFTLAYQRTLHLRTRTGKESPLRRETELTDPRLRVLEESLSRDIQHLSEVLESEDLVTAPHETSVVEAAQLTLQRAETTLAHLRSTQVTERRSARLRELENLTRSATATIQEVQKTT